MKLSAVLKGYWLDKELEFSPNTVRQYQYVFRYLVDFLGDVEFGQITSDDIRRFLLWLLNERKVSKRTVHDYWITCSSLWTWAENELQAEHIIRNKVTRPSYTKKVIEPFDADEIRQIVKATDETVDWTTRSGRTTKSKRSTAARDKAIVLTLVDTGMRASELCNLTIADYDQRRGRFHIRQGKGDKGRYVVAGNRTQKALWRYLSTRPKAKQRDPLFITRGGALDRTNLYHMIKRFGDRAGIANTHPHKFRHTFAVTFLRNGGNVRQLQELLGHESMEMVMHYVKLAEQDLEEAARHSPVDNWKL